LRHQLMDADPFPFPSFSFLCPNPCSFDQNGSPAPSPSFSSPLTAAEMSLSADLGDRTLLPFSPFSLFPVQEIRFSRHERRSLFLRSIRSLIKTMQLNFFFLGFPSDFFFFRPYSILFYDLILLPPETLPLRCPVKGHPPFGVFFEWVPFPWRKVLAISVFLSRRRG